MGYSGTALIVAAAASAYGAAKKKGYIGGGPKVGAVPPMPDINQTTQAQTLQEAQAAAVRQGRASTILTTPATTGDSLGP